MGARGPRLPSTWVPSICTGTRAHRRSPTWGPPVRGWSSAWSMWRRRRYGDAPSIGPALLLLVGAGWAPDADPRRRPPAREARARWVGGEHRRAARSVPRPRLERRRREPRVRLGIGPQPAPRRHRSERRKRARARHVRRGDPVRDQPRLDPPRLPGDGGRAERSTRPGPLGPRPRHRGGPEGEPRACPGLLLEPGRGPAVVPRGGDGGRHDLGPLARLGWTTQLPDGSLPPERDLGPELPSVL